MSIEHDTENLDVFRRFLDVAPFVADSPQLESPPKPDVSCERDGQLWYFELVRAVNAKIAKSMGDVEKAAKNRPDEMAGAIVLTDPGDGFFEAIRVKAAKRYAVDAPLDLLIWIDRRRDPTARETFPFVEGQLRQAVRSSGGPWRTVWVFDPDRNEILLEDPLGR